VATSETIELIIRARDLASKTVLGASGALRQFGGSMNALKLLMRVNVFLQLANAAMAGVRAVAEWKKRHVDAIMSVAKANQKLQVDLAQAGRIDFGLRNRREEAERQLPGRGNGISAEELKAQQEKEAAARRVTEIEDEKTALVKLAAEQDEVAERYKGVAGAATLAGKQAREALERVVGKRAARSVDMSRNDENYAAEQSRYATLEEQARARIVDSQTQMQAASTKQTEAEKKRAETIDQIAVAEAKLTAAKRDQVELGKVLTLEYQVQARAAEAEANIENAKQQEALAAQFKDEASALKQKLVAGMTGSPAERRAGRAAAREVEKEKREEEKINRRLADQVERAEEKQRTRQTLSKRDRDLLALKQAGQNFQIAAAQAQGGVANNALDRLAGDTPDAKVDRKATRAMLEQLLRSAGR